MNNYLPKVRQQYEALPYPERNPADEEKRLLTTAGDMFEYLNHYAFGGHMKSEGFRVLVAGGGTGDSTIYLAEQMRRMQGAQVVHLDLSEASIAIAKARAHARGLQNITFIQASLLDLPQMDIGRFDYINCSGVLHHLASPEDGLNALQSVLDENGVMLLMVYAAYGRMGIYHMQELMRQLCETSEDFAQDITYTRAVLDSAKAAPWMALLNLKIIQNEIQHAGDAGLYDLFLHSQDRAYSVPQLYEWIEGCGLTLAHWVADAQTHYKHLFSPQSVSHTQLKALIAKKPKRQQEAILEMLHGHIAKHILYVSRYDLKPPSPNDESLIPDFSFFAGYDSMRKDFAALQPQHDGQRAKIKRGAILREFAITPILRALVQQINGQNSIGSIIDNAYNTLLDNKTLRPHTRQQVQQAFLTLYHELNFSDWVLLRSPKLVRFPSQDVLAQQRLRI